jgi:SAM-dependent methyltransferase
MTGSCLVCGSTGVAPFVEVARAPVLCNVLWPTREAARRAPTANVRLGFCGECGHVFNLDFDPRVLDYTAAYENSLHFSECFQDYARQLATRLVRTHRLYGKEIVEIGCGQGDFLALLCELGGNRGYGFDPAYAGPDPDPGREGRLTIVRGRYPSRDREYPADFVCSRQTLEHVEDPKAVLTALRRALGDREGVGVFFEVPDAAATIRNLAVWDIIYEHVSYFTRPSLARAFRECGFAVRGVESLFGGQFLGVEATPAAARERRVDEEAGALTEFARDVSAFPDRYRSKLDGWGAVLDGLRANGQRAVVWGAGSKGVTFLNTLGLHDQIEYVVDVNPRKQGKHVAGTGQAIVPPEFLRDYRPDVVILMNPIYLGECRRLAARVGIDPTFICG